MPMPVDFLFYELQSGDLLSRLEVAVQTKVALAEACRDVFRLKTRITNPNAEGYAELRTFCQFLSTRSFELRDFYYAWKILQESDDTAALFQMGHTLWDYAQKHADTWAAFEAHCVFQKAKLPFLACRALAFAVDRDPGYNEGFTDGFRDRSQWKRVDIKDWFKTWGKEKGLLNRCTSLCTPRMAHLAISLRGRFDLVVGIADAVNQPAFVFSRCGHDVRMLRVSRIGNGQRTRRLRWLDALSEVEAEGTRILVLENDISTGRTLKRVLEEPQFRAAKSLTLLMTDENYDEKQKRYRPSRIELVPSEFAEVISPRDFGFQGIEKSIAIFAGLAPMPDIEH